MRNGAVLLGHGDGTFRRAPNLPVAVGAMAVGDFNGDAIPDLAVANRGSNNVSILLGNGPGVENAECRVSNVESVIRHSKDPPATAGDTVFIRGGETP